MVLPKIANNRHSHSGWEGWVTNCKSKIFSCIHVAVLIFLILDFIVGPFTSKDGNALLSAGRNSNLEEDLSGIRGLSKPVGLSRYWDATREDTIIGNTAGDPYYLFTRKMELNVEGFGWPVVHVVQSRFQIGQGKLRELSRSRFELFKHFTFPSVVAQTSQKFLWLIHVGHELSPSLFQEIVDIMKPHENIYVVKNDFPSGRYALRTFDEWLFLDGMLNFTIHSGNRSRLEHAMAITAYSKWKTKKQKTPPIVTTRLDMDDAVEPTYFEQIQESAIEAFVKNPRPPKYLFWCILNTLEWNFVWNQTLGGSFKPMSYTKCPSTGLTMSGSAPIGMGLGEHNLLREKMAQKHPETDKDFFGCGYSNSSDCLIIYPDLKGFRSRAPTSNSYFFAKDWETEQASFQNYNKGYQRKLSEEVQKRFLIDTKTSTETVGSHVYINEYFNNHLCEIINDFTQSYCSTRGFTCAKRVKDEYDHLQAKLECSKAN